MFVLEALPARHGDALWLSWGEPDAPRHLLVDGGPMSSRTRAVLESRVDGRPMELVVVTHIDADHVTGVLGLLERRTVTLQAGEVWFNGWAQLPTDLLGAKQGERLGAAIVRRKLGWNTAFRGGAVVVPDDGPLPICPLPGGLTLTLLGPSRAELAALRPSCSSATRTPEG
jgi:glyoxylase-like metal-dependent hydrolase (beta-lactamase superfamily II)